MLVLALARRARFLGLYPRKPRIVNYKILTLRTALCKVFPV
jgi:hypothetical protein